MAKSLQFQSNGRVFMSKFFGFGMLALAAMLCFAPGCGGSTEATQSQVVQERPGAAPEAEGKGKKGGKSVDSSVAPSEAPLE